jgi:hypothetical protein
MTGGRVYSAAPRFARMNLGKRPARELQDKIHSCSIETIMYGVNVFDEDYGQEAAAAFVVAAELPIFWEPVFTRAELDSYPETSWMSEGCWSIDKGDERVRDFPPE